MSGSVCASMRGNEGPWQREAIFSGADPYEVFELTEVCDTGPETGVDGYDASESRRDRGSMEAKPGEGGTWVEVRRSAPS